MSIIFSPTILAKYERIFSFLLRLLKTEDAMSRLFRSNWWRCAKSVPGLGDSRLRDAHIFRFEGARWCQSFQRYCMIYGIENAWSKFQNRLNDYDFNPVNVDHKDSNNNRMRKLVEDDTEKQFAKFMEYSSSFDLPHLYSLHGETLDCILFRLFLRSKQKSVMDIIIGIFDILIQFSNHVNMNEDDGVDIDFILKLYEQFKLYNLIFVQLLNTLITRNGREVEAFTILLHMMDPNEFVSERAKSI